MGIVFDEVVGEVTPDTTPAREEEEEADSASQTPPLLAETFQRYLYRLELREARLRAD